MAAKRFALIGHSGAGKAACLLVLGTDLESADMDNVFGTKRPPSLGAVLDWLSGASSPVVAVCNHEQTLRELLQAKLAGMYAAKFTSVCFVYLRKSKLELQAHLSLPKACGRHRDPAGRQYTLDHYELLDGFYAQLADRTVDTNGKNVRQLAAEIRELAELLRPYPA